MTAPITTRRRLLALASVLAASPLLATPARAAPGNDEADPPASALELTPPANAALADATLLVGGPRDGAAGTVANLVAPLIAPGLLGEPLLGPIAPPLEARVTVDPTGGLDGVTAANAFETRATQDGTTALVVPGIAALAWLAGDPRCHFDAGLWVPAMAALAPVILVGRAGPAAPPLTPGSILRLAASSPTGREMSALLALDLLGVTVEPRFDLRLDADAQAALQQGSVDAIVLAGRNVPDRLARLVADGFAPLFTMGGTIARDPSLPSIASFDETSARLLGRAPAGPLVPAYRASAAATRLDTAIVLPQLASAGIVARWRAACDTALASLSLRSATAAQGLEPLAGPDCVAAVAGIIAGETAQLDLHRFLADRYGWRPA